jgi:hypothetical protein
VSGYVDLQTYKKLPQHLKVLPNPNDGHFTLEISGLQGSKIEVNLMDLKGNLVEQLQGEMECESEPWQMDYSNRNLPSGVYLVQLIVNGEQKQSEKIIISR